MIFTYDASVLTGSAPDAFAAKALEEGSAQSALLGDQGGEWSAALSCAKLELLDQFPPDAAAALVLRGHDMAEHRHRRTRRLGACTSAAARADMPAQTIGIAPHPGCGEHPGHLRAHQQGGAAIAGECHAAVLHNPVQMIGIGRRAEQRAHHAVLAMGNECDAVRREREGFLIKTEEIAAHPRKKTEPEIGFVERGRCRKIVRLQGVYAQHGDPRNTVNLSLMRAGCRCSLHQQKWHCRFPAVPLACFLGFDQ